jgi:DNA topoisomerase IA
MGKTEAHADMVAPPKGSNRKGKLVIVESPAKARTVGRFLGKEYTVKASVGHVRDLLRSQLSVDVDNNFEPKYRIPNEKRPVVKEIQALAKTHKEIYLATDPDREGEAIAWHLLEFAKIDPKLTQRAVFHEITSQLLPKPSLIRVSTWIWSMPAGAAGARPSVGYNLARCCGVRCVAACPGRVQSVALADRRTRAQNRCFYTSRILVDCGRVSP